MRVITEFLVWSLINDFTCSPIHFPPIFHDSIPRCSYAQPPIVLQNSKQPFMIILSRSSAVGLELAAQMHLPFCVPSAVKRSRDNSFQLEHHFQSYARSYIVY